MLFCKYPVKSIILGMNPQQPARCTKQCQKKALGRALQSWIHIFPSLNSSSFLAVSLSVSIISARVMDYFPFYVSIHVNNNVSQPNNSLQLFLKAFIDYS